MQKKAYTGTSGKLYKEVQKGGKPTEKYQKKTERKPERNEQPCP